ncbi:radical SAM protein [Pyrolobus fumarii]|uniref:radical SAM protein n=1 Tax=Pyrolobus fumarii TaxID=54252 RepID=UPI001AE0DEC3|nr:CofH family radical SAM protein [Pyrolobus fumarii]
MVKDSMDAGKSVAYKVFEKMKGRLSYVESVEKLLHGEANVKAIVDAFQEDLNVIGALANIITEGVTGRRVGYIINMILNYTNVCTVRCKFCAFHVKPGSQKAFTITPSEAAKIVREHYERFRIRQVLVQGGVNPELRLDYFVALFRAIKDAVKGRVAIHGLSPVEIEWLSKVEGESIKRILEELRSAGLDSIPGGGAEILAERTRRILSPLKGLHDSWLRVMSEAMKLGIPISATMMYGHIESLAERAEHLIRILELQRKYGKIMAFIAWNYEPAAELKKLIPYAATGIEHLRVIAVARLVFRDEIRFIQAGWLTAGREVAQLALWYGANDWGGSLYNEKVLPAAGVELPLLVRESIERMIRSVGREPYERDNFYRPVR